MLPLCASKAPSIHFSISVKIDTPTDRIAEAHLSLQLTEKMSLKITGERTPTRLSRSVESWLRGHTWKLIPAEGVTDGEQGIWSDEAIYCPSEQGKNVAIPKNSHALPTARYRISRLRKGFSSSQIPPPTRHTSRSGADRAQFLVKRADSQPKKRVPVIIKRSWVPGPVKSVRKAVQKRRRVHFSSMRKGRNNSANHVAVETPQSQRAVAEEKGSSYIVAHPGKSTGIAVDHFLSYD